MPVKTKYLTSYPGSKVALIAEGIEVGEQDNLFGQLIGGHKAPILTINDLKRAGSGWKADGIPLDTGRPSLGVKGLHITAEGQEDKLANTTTSIDLTARQYGLEVGDKREKQYLILDKDELVKNRIARWYADRIEGGYDGIDSNGNSKAIGDGDGLIDKLLATTPATLFANPAHYTINTGAGTDIADGDYFTFSTLSNWWVDLKNGYYSNDSGTVYTYRRFVPASAIGYKDVFFVIANPAAYLPLKNTANWRTYMESYQYSQTGDNPLMAGYARKHVLGQYEGFVCLYSDRMPIYKVNGVRYAKILLMGAQGGLYAPGMTLPDKEATDKTGTIDSIYVNSNMGVAQTIAADDNKAFNCLTAVVTLK